MYWLAEFELSWGLYTLILIFNGIRKCEICADWKMLTRSLLNYYVTTHNIYRWAPKPRGHSAITESNEESGEGWLGAGGGGEDTPSGLRDRPLLWSPLSCQPPPARLPTATARRRPAENWLNLVNSTRRGAGRLSFMSAKMARQICVMSESCKGPCRVAASNGGHAIDESCN